MSRYSEIQKEINARFRERFRAAEAFARLVAPDDPSLAEDLWLHWETPAAFAAKHPAWYRDRWRIDIHDPDLDWFAQDVNPWSHLQDCLGVRGLTVVVPPEAPPAQIITALDNSSMVLPEPAVRWAWVAPEVLALALEPFLAEASRQFRARSGRVLAQMHDFWSPERVLAAVPASDLPTLEALALRSDIYGQGLQVLGAEPSPRDVR